MYTTHLSYFIDFLKTLIPQYYVLNKSNNVVNEEAGFNQSKEHNSILFEDFSSCINKFKYELKKPNHRFLSWEHCYKVFYQYRSKKDLSNEDYDYLCLHLAFYLASWGMLRGSSFLLQKDYQVHLEAVKEIMRKEYDCLLSIKAEDLIDDEKLVLLDKLSQNLNNQYIKIKNTIKDSNSKTTDTLLTKILLGVLGCVPAYDQYFVNSLKYLSITPCYSPESIKQIAILFKELTKDKKPDSFEIELDKGIKYPDMKLFDMALWEYGMILSSNAKLNTKINQQNLTKKI